MTWKPKKGDTVKLVTAKTWGANEGAPIMIRRAKVARVSSAGYITVDARPHERFRQGDSEVQHIAREWTPKKFGQHDYLKHIIPITEEEAEQLPDTDQAGREYARRLKTLET